jgi:hypothetical protein
MAEVIRQEVEKVGRILTSVGGSGMAGPASVRTRFCLPELPDLKVTVKVEPVDGVYEITELWVASRTDERVPVTTGLLRQIPLRTLVELAVGTTLRSLNLAEVLVAEDVAGTAGNNEMREVVHRYRIARLVGAAPTEAVAVALGVSRATAARRVARARELGLLGIDEIGAGGGRRRG